MADEAVFAWSVLCRAGGTEPFWNGHVRHLRQQHLYPFPEHQSLAVPPLELVRLKSLMQQLPAWNASGPDGWSVRELQSSHDYLLVWLVDFL